LASCKATLRIEEGGLSSFTKKKREKKMGKKKKSTKGRGRRNSNAVETLAFSGRREVDVFFWKKGRQPEGGGANAF